MADSYDDPESDTYSGNVLESSQSNKVLAIDTWKVTIPKLVYTIPYNVDGLCPYKVESDNWGKLMEKCKDDRPWKTKTAASNGMIMLTYVIRIANVTLYA